MKNQKIRNMTLIAMFSALSAVVMLFEFPLPFAPPFYKIDFSEVVNLIGTFALGPVAGVIITFLKNVIKIIIRGTETAYIGEVSNFIVSCTYIVPAGIIYHFNKNKKGAVVGMAVGTLSMTIIASLMNWLFLLPVYSVIYGIPMDALISAGTERNGLIKNMATFIVFATMPFNLIKGVVSSVISFFIYKRISRLIKRGTGN